MPWGSSGCSVVLKTRKRYDGQVILAYFCLAGLVRFVVEFFRSPTGLSRPHIIWAMPLTQVIALGLAVVSGGLLLYFGRRAAQPKKINVGYWHRPRRFLTPA